MEMQGRAEDGIGWMIAREPYWSGDDNFFKVHNWWHRALYHMDLGQIDEALALYDGPVREGRSAVALDLVDASALLWRLHLLGEDVGNRWQELSAAWDQHADAKTYSFNDWHAVMAYLGAGRDREVQAIRAAYRNDAVAGTESARWARDIGLPLIEGFAAFWRGDYQTAADRLHGARYIVNGFGGSHAQRDVIDWTLTEAAVRGGLTDLAEALAHERLALKPHSPHQPRLPCACASGRNGVGGGVMTRAPHAARDAVHRDRHARGNPAVTAQDALAIHRLARAREAPGEAEVLMGWSMPAASHACLSASGRRSSTAAGSSVAFGRWGPVSWLCMDTGTSTGSARAVPRALSPRRHP
jgi:hypothetical protein